MVKNKVDVTGLEYKFIQAEQFDVYENFEETDEFDYDTRDRTLVEMTASIGFVFLNFGELEHALELVINVLFSDRSSHVGMQVNKFLEYSEKVGLFSEMATGRLAFENPELKSKIKEITKQLMKAGELRNVVAHAKWFSLTPDGYVRSQVKLNKETGLMQVKYYRLNKEILEEIRREIESTEIMLNEFAYERSWT